MKDNLVSIIIGTRILIIVNVSTVIARLHSMPFLSLFMPLSIVWLNGYNWDIFTSSALDL